MLLEMENSWLNNWVQRKRSVHWRLGEQKISTLKYKEKNKKGHSLSVMLSVKCFKKKKDRKEIIDETLDLQEGMMSMRNINTFLKLYIPLYL